MKLVDIPVARTFLDDAEKRIAKGDKSTALQNLCLAVERIELSKRKIMREWERSVR